MSRQPRPGDIWRSRDKRDGGLTVTVLEVSAGRVTYLRHTRRTVMIYRFVRAYSFVNAQAPDA